MNKKHKQTVKTKKQIIKTIKNKKKNKNKLKQKTKQCNQIL